jgi:pilus assembly protein CpaC
LSATVAICAALYPAPLCAQAAPQPARELTLTVGKSLVVNTAAPIERVATGFGDIAEATPVGPRELLVNAKAPGETSLIVWQQGGNKLFFDVVVRPNTTNARNQIEAVRRQIQQDVPGQNIQVSFENGAVFLRGTVKDLNSAERASAIASTLGKPINLMYVDVPAPDAQILLKVQFASVDRSASTQLGLNLISTGATNTIARITTGQFTPPLVTPPVNQPTNVSLSDALNIFLFRPDLDLAATIKALQTNNLFEILAEPNVLASDGKQASFVAGGEFPYPTLQGGAAGIGQITIQFREFGVRINFLPIITPRGTIKLEVVPEVSALDFSNGLTFQGFTIPGLTLRRVHTNIELSSGQSFAIGGLLDRRLTDNLSKIPFLGDIPLLGKLFQSRSLQKQNTELLVIVTPELVRPIPAGQPRPQLEYPEPLTYGPHAVPRTPGVQVTGPVPVPASRPIPVERLVQSLRTEDTTKLLEEGRGYGENGSGLNWPSVQPVAPVAPAPAAPMPAAPIR